MSTPTVPKTSPPFVIADLGEAIKYILEQLAAGGGGAATSIAINSAGSGNWDGSTSPAIIRVPTAGAINLVLVNNVAGDSKFGLISIADDGSLDIYANDYTTQLHLGADGSISLSVGGGNTITLNGDLLVPNITVGSIGNGVLDAGTINLATLLSLGNNGVITSIGNFVIATKEADSSSVQITAWNGTISAALMVVQSGASSRLLQIAPVDANDVVNIHATEYRSADGSQGASGTFLALGGQTVTVKNGLITSIV